MTRRATGGSRGTKTKQVERSARYTSGANNFEIDVAVERKNHSPYLIRDDSGVNVETSSKFPRTEARCKLILFRDVNGTDCEKVESGRSDKQQNKNKDFVA